MFINLFSCLWWNVHTPLLIFFFKTKPTSASLAYFEVCFISIAPWVLIKLTYIFNSCPWHLNFNLSETLCKTEKPTVRAQTRSFTTCLSTVADQVVSGFFLPLLTAAHHTSKIPLSCVCAAQCYPAVPRFQSDQAFVGFTRTSSIQRDRSPQQRKPKDLQCCSYSLIT